MLINKGTDWGRSMEGSGQQWSQCQVAHTKGQARQWDAQWMNVNQQSSQPRVHLLLPTEGQQDNGHRGSMRALSCSTDLIGSGSVSGFCACASCEQSGKGASQNQVLSSWGMWLVQKCTANRLWLLQGLSVNAAEHVDSASQVAQAVGTVQGASEWPRHQEPGSPGDVACWSHTVIHGPGQQMAEKLAQTIKFWMASQSMRWVMHPLIVHWQWHQLPLANCWLSVDFLEKLCNAIWSGNNISNWVDGKSQRKCLMCTHHSCNCIGQTHGPHPWWFEFVIVVCDVSSWSTEQQRLTFQNHEMGYYFATWS